MPPKLSTHVLDTANGCPAGNMRVELWSLDGPAPTKLKEFRTNADGRNGDGPLLDEATMKVGKYELRFHVAEYFAMKNPETPKAPSGVAFLDVVPVQFGIPDAAQGYHVPLLCSQWSYSTYRGS